MGRGEWRGGGARGQIHLNPKSVSLSYPKSPRGAGTSGGSVRRCAGVGALARAAGGASWSGAAEARDPPIELPAPGLDSRVTLLSWMMWINRCVG